MRHLFALILVCTISPAAASDKPIRLSEPVASTAGWEYFGRALPDGTPRPLSAVVAEAGALDGTQVIIETEVVQVCRKKGCFFIARDGEATARVTFRDYGFFVPTDAAGKRVVLAGTFERRAITADQAAHYAEDLGETSTDGLEGGFEYAITADAVRIPRG